MTISSGIPNLKEFLLQRRVLKLYKDFFRITKEIPNEANRKEIQDWIRRDFKEKKNEKDVYAIKLFIHSGERSLKKLQNSINLCKYLARKKCIIQPETAVCCYQGGGAHMAQHRILVELKSTVWPHLANENGTLNPNVPQRDMNIFIYLCYPNGLRFVTLHVFNGLKIESSFTI